jgi:ribosomal protein S18 acetylase RimI-like enzyme
MKVTGIKITPIEDKNRERVNTLIKKEWGSINVVSRGKTHDVSELPGFIAYVDEELAGIITFKISDGIQPDCEIVTINSFKEKSGVGSALIQEVTRYASAHACKRLWLITTNDNLQALRFYQRRGFRIKDIHVGAIEKSREIKPEIPLIGRNGILIRDEIELELKLIG